MQLLASACDAAGFGDHPEVMKMLVID
jgi:hypothetical protein